MSTRWLNSTRRSVGVALACCLAVPMAAFAAELPSTPATKPCALPGDLAPRCPTAVVRAAGMPVDGVSSASTSRGDRVLVAGPDVYGDQLALSAFDGATGRQLYLRGAYIGAEVVATTGLAITP